MNVVLDCRSGLKVGNALEAHELAREASTNMKAVFAANPVTSRLSALPYAMSTQVFSVARLPDEARLHGCGVRVEHVSGRDSMISRVLGEMQMSREALAGGPSAGCTVLVTVVVTDDASITPELPQADMASPTLAPCLSYLLLKGSVRMQGTIQPATGVYRRVLTNPSVPRHDAGLQSSGLAATTGGKSAGERLQLKIARALLRRVPNQRALIRELPTLHIMFRRMPLPVEVTENLDSEIRALAAQHPDCLRLVKGVDDDGVEQEYVELLAGACTNASSQPASAQKWKISATTIKHVQSVLYEAGDDGLEVRELLRKYRETHNHDLVISPFGGASATLRAVPNAIVETSGEKRIARLDDMGKKIAEENLRAAEKAEQEGLLESKSDSSRSSGGSGSNKNRDRSVSDDLVPGWERSHVRSVSWASSTSFGAGYTGPHPRSTSDFSDISHFSDLSDLTAGFGAIGTGGMSPETSSPPANTSPLGRTSASDLLPPDALEGLLTRCPRKRAYLDEIATLHFMFRRAPLDRRPFRSFRDLMKQLLVECPGRFSIYSEKDLDGLEVVVVESNSWAPDNAPRWHVASQVRSKVASLLLSAGVSGVPLHSIRDLFSTRFGGQAMVVSPWGCTSLMLRQISDIACVEKQGDDVVVVHTALRGCGLAAPLWEEHTLPYGAAPNRKAIEEYLVAVKAGVESCFGARIAYVRPTDVLLAIEEMYGPGSAIPPRGFSMWDALSALPGVALVASGDRDVVLTLANPAVRVQAAHGLSPGLLQSAVDMLETSLSTSLPLPRSSTEVLPLSSAAPILSFLRGAASDPRLVADLVRLTKDFTVEVCYRGGRAQLYVIRRAQLGPAAPIPSAPMAVTSAVPSFGSSHFSKAMASAGLKESSPLVTMASLGLPEKSPPPPGLEHVVASGVSAVPSASLMSAVGSGFAPKPTSIEKAKMMSMPWISTESPTCSLAEGVCRAVFASPTV